MPITLEDLRKFVEQTRGAPSATPLVIGQGLSANGFAEATAIQMMSKYQPIRPGGACYLGSANDPATHVAIF